METIQFDSSHLHDEIMAQPKKTYTIPLMIIGFIAGAALFMILKNNKQKEKKENNIVSV